jgi:hypothetical protein
VSLPKLKPDSLLITYFFCGFFSFEFGFFKVKESADMVSAANKLSEEFTMTAIKEYIQDVTTNPKSAFDEYNLFPTLLIGAVFVAGIAFFFIQNQPQV